MAQKLVTFRKMKSEEAIPQCGTIHLIFNRFSLAFLFLPVSLDMVNAVETLACWNENEKNSRILLLGKN
jgi:hypothetical protein